MKNTTERTDNDRRIRNACGLDLDAPAPLYHRYQGQTKAQPAYLALDCLDSRLWADWDGEIGNAVPMSVWHGHVQRWTIPNDLTGKAINCLLEHDEVLALAQRIVDGYESVWDGSNHVATFTEDADQAMEDMEKLLSEICDGLDRCEIWDAGDWLSECIQYRDSSVTIPMDDDRGDIVITAETTDEELEAYAERLQAEADPVGGGAAIIIEGMSEFLTELRDGCEPGEED